MKEYICANREFLCAYIFVDVHIYVCMHVYNIGSIHRQQRGRQGDEEIHMCANHVCIFVAYSEDAKAMKEYTCVQIVSLFMCTCVYIWVELVHSPVHMYLKTQVQKQTYIHAYTCRGNQMPTFSIIRMRFRAPLRRMINIHIYIHTYLHTYIQPTKCLLPSLS
jgi:hypothetical protein